MTIEEYFGDWAKVVDLDEANRIVKRISCMRVPVCPKIRDVFKAFELCSLQELRVLVLGQDPYNDYINGHPVATGIAFGNSKDTIEDCYSPSLGILRESVIDFTIPHQAITFDPSLEKWEKQGVLMLNSALSCQQGRPGSHSLMWRPFIKSLLENLSKHLVGIVYVLLGTSAQSLEHCINTEFNFIIKEKHPSWYARARKPMPSSVWREINQILIGQNGHGIKWYEEL